ncbi:transcriptional regulator with XRE-family HTH domain [Crossiella equi]|uniref:Transcriptional regulator with XRE-family HTH domain n=1 Tax=Crossiella equi TaxID=130796 RepID=A0ABS5AHD2_9PSEU|nr:helix-turn-helix transcriptional regulator [Crossiella equi]MBP2475983.1 transcriptional regulator with XRE-family HTH domain [Crossiella equi]
MEDEESTARRRELGDLLRQHRVRAQVSRAELCEYFDWSMSKVSRLEAGKRGVSETDLTRYLAYCRVGNDEVDRLIGLHRQPDPGCWARPHDGRFADGLRTVTLHEGTAIALYGYAPTLIPPQLQAEGYARVLLGPEGDVRARLARAEVLPRLAEGMFFVHEAALRAVVGGPQVMVAQLHHLLRHLAWVRVVPMRVSPVQAAVNGFALLRFRDHRPLVLVETEGASLVLEHRVALDRYQTVLDSLRTVALGRTGSGELLRRLVEDLVRARSGEAGTGGDLAGCAP